MRRHILASLFAVAFVAPALAQPTLSAPDKVAIFKAAGFKLQAGKYTRCPDDTAPSHTFGAIEAIDLNGDGAAEALVRETSTYCYGNTEQATVVLGRDKAGAWKILLDQVGMDAVEKTKANGWLNITIGGPGMGTQPLFKYNGAKYVLAR